MKKIDDEKIDRTIFLKAIPAELRNALIEEMQELLQEKQDNKRDDLDEDIRAWARAKEKIFKQINQRV